MHMAAVLEAIFTPEGFMLESRGTLSGAEKEWKEAFDKDPQAAWYALGFARLPEEITPSFAWLARVASTFADLLAAKPQLEVAREATEVPLEESQAESLLEQVPFCLGSEFLDADWIEKGFARLQAAFQKDAAGFEGSMKKYFAQKNEGIHLSERIYFHLVENKNDADYPFAFLATYAAKTDKGKIRHLPLGHVLKEFQSDDPKLLSLLSCLSKVCALSDFLDEIVTSGEIFHPLQLSSQEAYWLLQAWPAIEQAGISFRVPNWWKKKQSSVSLQISMGQNRSSLVGLDSLLSATPTLVVDGRKLSLKEMKELLAQDEGLYLLKGSWVEVDHEKLKQLMDLMAQSKTDLSFLDVLKLQAGLEENKTGLPEAAQITNGRWLSTLLNKLSSPDQSRNARLPKSIKASLHPWQKTGYSWLETMASLHLGACLADDMGLGKTLQVLSHLESLRQRQPDAKVLLAAPASLLMNWKKEAARFVPSMDVKILHGEKAEVLNAAIEAEDLAFLNITTYAMVTRLRALAQREWDVVVLDEAQAIKNPGTKQTRAIKALMAKERIAMTGTPIENDLSNLWSLFDFLNQGLLGTRTQFARYCKSLEQNPANYARLRKMIAPFLLRRLKTDKTIVKDLPEKIERPEYISLSRKQTALYLDQIQALEQSLQEAREDDIQRKGMVLAAISRFKQICNHPDQFLSQNTYKPEESGKFEVLKEICQTIAQKHECVLVFTQYREIIPALDAWLQEVFGLPGMVIHGGVPVEKRQELVDAFNAQKTYIPYMVLSLRAAGTGLNLTRANHVVHFDRWWNPAVENQATDRAFRIGQKQNVVVHTFISAGTIEEKIDEMIAQKKDLAEKVTGSSPESWITELSNEELLDLVRLDV